MGEEKIINIESNKLTDQQVDQLSKALSEAESEDNKLFKELPSNNGTNERVPEDPYAYEEARVTSFIDPLTQQEMIIPEEIDPLENIKLDTSGLDALMDMSDEDIKTMKISEEELMKCSALSDITGLNKSDISAIKKVYDKYRVNMECPYSMYNSLPSTMKKYVDNAAKLLASERNLTNIQEIRSVIIKSIFESISFEVFSNKTYTDLNTTIEKAYSDMMKEVASEGALTIRRKIMSFPEIANKIRDTDPERAESIDKFYESYVESYTYNDLINTVNTGKLRAKKIEIDKFDRTAKNFNMKFEKSTKIVDDVSRLPFIISNNLGYNIRESIRMVIAYIKYVEYKKLDINKLEDYSFLYYFPKNIINLLNYSETTFDEVKFYTDLKNNLAKLHDAVMNIEDNIINR